MCETCSIRATRAGPPPIAAYVRSATDDPSRVAAQVARIQYYVEQRGWELRCIYTDNGLSGNSSNRPGIQRLQHDIEAGLVDIIIVERFDRLYRNLQGLFSFVRLAERCNTTLVSLGEERDLVLGSVTIAYVNTVLDTRVWTMEPVVAPAQVAPVPSSTGTGAGVAAPVPA